MVPVKTGSRWATPFQQNASSDKTLMSRKKNERVKKVTIHTTRPNFTLLWFIRLNGQKKFRILSQESLSIITLMNIVATRNN